MSNLLHVSGEKLNASNAEDITCNAVSKTLDLVRHFRIPDFLDKRLSEDEDGFKYREERWTKQIIFIPIKSISEAKSMMEKYKYGYHVIYHSDGNKWDICKDIIDMGADSINPFETLATMDIKRFRALYPDTVCGSMIDCQDLLAFGTPEQITQATRKALEDSVGARTLIGSTSEIHPEIKLENALAMYEAASNYSF